MGLAKHIVVRGYDADNVDGAIYNTKMKIDSLPSNGTLHEVTPPVLPLEITLISPGISSVSTCLPAFRSCLTAFPPQRLSSWGT